MALRPWLAYYLPSVCPQHDTREAAALCRQRLETLSSLTGGDLSRLAEAALRLASPPAESAAAARSADSARQSAGYSAYTVEDLLSDPSNTAGDTASDTTGDTTGDTVADTDDDPLGHRSSDEPLTPTFEPSDS